MTCKSLVLPDPSPPVRPGGLAATGLESWPGWSSEEALTRATGAGPSSAVWAGQRLPGAVVPVCSSPTSCLCVRFRLNPLQQQPPPPQPHPTAAPRLGSR